MSVLLPLGGLMLAVAFLLPERFLFEGAAAYAPLHTILEVFAVVVAAQVFGAGWFGSADRNATGATIIACLFLAVGLLDLGHVLSYLGIPDFVTPNSAHKAILFWFAARVAAAVGLVLTIAAHYTGGVKVDARVPVLVVTLLAVAGLFWLILFHEASLPETFIPGEGLTSFKIGTEIVLVAVYFSCALIFFLALLKNEWVMRHAG